MDAEWTNFYLAAAGAAAALTGLLFVAVSLRPREIRQSPLMVGRARSAFYAFVTVLLGTLLALAGTSSRLVGVVQLGVGIGVLALSAPFTVRAGRARTLNYPRAIVYHAGLVVVAAAGAVRAFNGTSQHYAVVLATGVMLLLGIALTNSWQLVLSHEPAGDGPLPDE
jgi:uncharacterized membrane protein YjjP (DUF1212 family)